MYIFVKNQKIFFIVRVYKKNFCIVSYKHVYQDINTNIFIN